MSLTATATGTPTVTDLLSFTTPFIETGNCYKYAQKLRPSVVRGETQYSPYLVSDPTLEGFTSCQPSGWASVVPGSRFSFSPAVCPSGWAAWEIGTTTPEVGSAVITTAWCCDRPFTLYPSAHYAFASPGFEKPCINTGTDGDVNLSLHIPWHISWQDVDIPILTPAPPALSAGETLRFWDAGWDAGWEAPSSTPTIVESADNDGGLSGLGRLVLGLALGLGGGLVILIIVCVCCCRGRRAIDATVSPQSERHQSSRLSSPIGRKR
ncbi:hypothetical protein BJY01DRAFT_227450 [Aspergillus pseudoustus]|uniref:Uncharacterized protein n=1 Tax=Aspergillus pseudoustus TaxID=1810923 RepID=A0ABR4IQW4_9EURO